MRMPKRALPPASLFTASRSIAAVFALTFATSSIATACSLDSPGTGEIVTMTDAAVTNDAANAEDVAKPEANIDASVEDSDALADNAAVDAELDGTVDALDAATDEAEAFAPRAAGETCFVASECATGFCANSVCCTSACEGTCETCDSSGVCAMDPAGVDPGGDCGGCIAACNGAGACSLCSGGVCNTAQHPLDCASTASCVQCDANNHCGTGRCDDCVCLPKMPNGVSCNEPTDCTSGKCGAGSVADAADCASTTTCVECEDDTQCGSQRCDGCWCVPSMPPGSICGEASDCSSGRCGAAAGTDPFDCAQQGFCSACDDDVQCGGQRCEGCFCIDKGPGGMVCNEDTDCVNGSCLAGACK